MTRKIYCSTCAENFIELPEGAPLTPDSAFTCKACYAPDNRIQGVKGFKVAHDPRLRRNSENRKVAAHGSQIDPEDLRHGFQIIAPKPIKGPEWSYSDAFLEAWLADRNVDERRIAMALVIGRWRQWKTCQELADETGQTVEETRQALSTLRAEGNALWRKKQRAAVKAERNRQLSLRAQALFARDLTVRQVAGILKCSVGLASELRQAS